MGALLQQIRHSHRHRRALACCLVIAFLLPACAPVPIFPPDVRDKADRTVTFENLTANPDHYHDRIVELGGQIVGSITEQDEVQMLVRELPIRTTPVYGPVDNGQLNGMFVIRFTGKIGAQDVQDGNVVVVIGAVMGAVATASHQAEVDSSVASARLARPSQGSGDCDDVTRTFLLGEKEDISNLG